MKVTQFLCEYAMVFSVIEVKYNQPCAEFTLAVELIQVQWDYLL